MVIPVVVEMRVSSVIECTAKAVVEVETAMRPRRNTGEPQWKSVDLRVSGWVRRVKPRRASFLRFRLKFRQSRRRHTITLNA